MAAPAFGHKNQPHHSTNNQVNDRRADLLNRINTAYVSTIKPIFQRSCFDCHSSATRFPWYSVFPIVRQVIEDDISEAKGHLEMTKDFPFEGHGSPSDDLSAIRETIIEKSMPPLRYRALHWDSSLSEKEKKMVLKWIEESLNTLTFQTDKDH